LENQKQIDIHKNKRLFLALHFGHMRILKEASNCKIADLRHNLQNFKNTGLWFSI